MSDVYMTRINEQGRLELLCPKKHRMHIGFMNESVGEVAWHCQECAGEESTKFRSVQLREAFPRAMADHLRRVLSEALTPDEVLRVRFKLRHIL